MLLYHLEHSGGNFLEYLETFRVVNLSLNKFNSEVLTAKIKSKCYIFCRCCARPTRQEVNPDVRFELVQQASTWRDSHDRTKERYEYIVTQDREVGTHSYRVETHD